MSSISSAVKFGNYIFCVDKQKIYQRAELHDILKYRTWGILLLQRKFLISTDDSR